jgi:hypothetical protein
MNAFDDLTPAQRKALKGKSGNLRTLKSLAKFGLTHETPDGWELTEDGEWAALELGLGEQTETTFKQGDRVVALFRIADTFRYIPASGTVVNRPSDWRHGPVVCVSLSLSEGHKAPLNFSPRNIAHVKDVEAAGLMDLVQGLATY